ncbi:tetratricopeptide repeat protein [Actinospica sp.]|uniref:tetratricopeptide repeat protein n=1 Tax=Actinospica sp. TaxID=1872142 RepID=UPI002C41B5EC|nr:tetratricopeptide repeat protein [Actinospica sp.]HWG27837.1 tetratricopeptide repeat protein [Actinospica sp.]
MTDTTRSRVEFDRAQQLYDLGRPAEALDAVGQILAGRPDNAEGLRLAALCLSAVGRQDEAVSTARAAVAAEPESEHGRRVLSHMHYKRAEFRLAANIALEATKLAPNEWRGHMLLARCVCHFDPKGALAPAERSRELGPDSPDTHFACALAYQAVGRQEDARAAYLKVLELNPQHAMALNNLAVLDRSARRWGRALRGFRRALSSDPHQDLARRNIDSILLSRVWRLTWLSVLAVDAVDAFAPALGGFAQRVLGSVLVAILVAGPVYTAWSARRAVGSYAWRFLRTDRRVLLCLALLTAAVLFITFGTIVQLFVVTDQYSMISFLVTLLLWLVSVQVRTMTRKTAPRSE